MRLLIYGINYAPELTGTGKYTSEMADWLAKQGHDVRVVTAPPYYPAWEVSAGYSALRYRRQRLGRVAIWRCPIWVPAKQSGAKRLLHLLSFALSSVPVMFGQIFWRPEVVIQIAPPLVCAPVALLVARASRARSWLHIQDFEIDAALQLGLLPRKGCLSALAVGFESSAIKRFDVVSSISKKMLERALDKGADPTKTFFFPNWANLKEIRPLERLNGIRSEIGFGDKEIVVLYAGNIGEKQGLELILDVAEATKGNPLLRYIIAGDGAARQRLEVAAKEKGLKNLKFLPVQQSGRFGELLAAANIHLVIQKSSAADLVLPSKVTNILAAGRPIIVTAERETELGQLIAGSKFGICVSPDSATQLREAIETLAAEPAKCARMGRAARLYAEEWLAADRILADFEVRLTNSKPRDMAETPSSV